LKNLKALVIIIVLALAVFVFVFFTPKAKNVDKDLVKSFLESQYVDEAGLLRAATHAHPDASRIYIASDNLLASRALATLKSPLAFRVLITLNESYGGGFDKLHEILLAVEIPDKFYCRYNEYLGSILTSKFGMLEIYYEKPNYNCTINNWEEYADLIVYKALYALLHGSKSHAEQLFEKLMGMWDGYGFRDAAFNGKYSTYKLALAIFLYKALKAANSNKIMKYYGIIDRCYEIIGEMQREDGGIVTDYEALNGKVTPVGDANTETTSMVILALYSNYPEKIGRAIENR